MSKSSSGRSRVGWRFHRLMAVAGMAPARIMALLTGMAHSQGTQSACMQGRGVWSLGPRALGLGLRI
jgi:hypothetical protein